MSTSHPPNAAIARVLELRALDERKYGTQARLAELTGLDQKSWSNYLAGKIPSRLAMRAIQRKLGISAKLWKTPAAVSDCHRNNPTDVQNNAQGPHVAETAGCASGETPTSAEVSP